MRYQLKLSHPDEFATGRIATRWFIANAGCHSGDLRFCIMSPGWHNAIYNLRWLTSNSNSIQIQKRFIVRCTKYTIQKHINIQGKTFWNNIWRIWYTDMTYDRHWMWGKLLRFRKRYLRFNGLRRDLHTRNQHCHDTKCRPFNARRTKTY